MNLSRSIFSVVAGSLLVGATVIAGPVNGENKQKLNLYEPVMVEGQQLAPGTYRLEWTGEGPDVQLSIRNGKEQVASVPARVVETNTKKDTDGYVATKEQNGENALTEIFFHGKSYELRIQGSSNGATQPSPSR